MAAICGMAVETMVASMAIMNIADITAARTRGRRGEVSGMGLNYDCTVNSALPRDAFSTEAVIELSSNCNLYAVSRCHKAASERKRVAQSDRLPP